MKGLIDILKARAGEILADKRKRWIAIVVLVLVLGFAAALPGYMKKTSTTEYCASCHVMLTQYDDWFYGGKHTQIRCVDCHLPNDISSITMSGRAWTGSRMSCSSIPPGPRSDTFFTSRRKTIQKNCVRCHEGVVSAISVDTMNCWDCHRKQFHNRINEF